MNTVVQEHAAITAEMSTEVDAREAWIERACELAGDFGDRCYRNLAERMLRAHLRTTPEGYVLVPPMVLAATLTISPFKGYENTEFQYHGELPAGTYSLYAAAQEGK